MKQIYLKGDMSFLLLTKSCKFAVYIRIRMCTCLSLSSERCKLTILCIAIIKLYGTNERFVWGVCMPIIMITMMMIVILIMRAVPNEILFEIVKFILRYRCAREKVLRSFVMIIFV